VHEPWDTLRSPYISPPLPSSSDDKRRQTQNQDQINATDSHYTALRSQARKIGDQAHSCFARSQAAFQRGDGQEAHELSVEGKRLMQEKDRVDDEAEEWIYRRRS